MNSVHDMGGMEGMGPIEAEANEPVFHEPWEGRVLALIQAAGAWGKWNIDASRHSRERIPGPEYLRASYYEKHLLGFLTILAETGLVTREELESGTPAPGAAKATPPLTAELVDAVLSKGNPVEREADAPPIFQPGDAVRARNTHPHGHTRLPRYARGRRGVIHHHHGTHVFPDANAHFKGEQPHHLYSVRFEAAELWGPDATGRGAVYIDLWEPYLEPT